MIVIKYKKRQLNLTLGYGVFLILLGVMGILYTDNSGFKGGFLGLGIVYLSIYFYNKHYHYLTIKNGILKDNSLFGKKITLSELIEIKKFSGDYILKTKNKELVLYTERMAHESQIALEKELQKLEVIRVN